MSPAAIVLLAAVVAAPAPARPKDPWIGVVVCLKAGSPDAYHLSADRSFELMSFRFRYLDVRCVDEKGDYVAVQHDDQVIWVKKESVLRPREAINYFTEAIDKDSTDERAISCRCWAYMAVREFDRALKDGEEAVRLNPGSTAWKNNRGEVFIKRKEYDKAIAEFTELLDSNPRYYFALLNRGEAYLRNRQFAKAKADIEAALGNDDKVPVLHANLARVLATAPDTKLRDGKRAVVEAKNAVDMIKYHDGRFLDTLAAAYAEAGEFDKAVAAQQKAIDDPEFMRDEGDDARKRLKLYRERKAFRDE
jgi:tetratricopeptide (TPR) repeat protein